MSNPLDIQVGGDHYKKYKIQPVEYIQANRLGWVEGSIVKYATRWRDKGGKQDLEKIKHLVDLLISLEEKEVNSVKEDKCTNTQQIMVEWDSWRQIQLLRECYARRGLPSVISHTSEPTPGG